MNEYDEQAVWFDVEEESLLGILARPKASAAADVGVVIIVGGPQYRTGSHRQFTLLARRLASEGFPTLRFDYRGMGDSTGDARRFTDIEADIAAANRVLMERAGVREVVLWGLCDGASASLLSVRRIPGVAGLALVNPWVSSTESLASVHLKHYYGARIRDAAFWRKLLGGKVSIGGSLRSLLTSLKTAASRVPARSQTAEAKAVSYQTRMAQKWRSFDGPILLALSGNDFTSREFLDHANQNEDWKGLLDAEGVSRNELAEADHTFSTAEWRLWLERVTLEWLIHRMRSGTAATARLGA